MTQLNEEHFEVIEKNKVEQYERQKLTYLEDRIKTLEKSVEAIHKVLGIAASKAMEINHE